MNVFYVEYGKVVIVHMLKMYCTYIYFIVYYLVSNVAQLYMGRNTGEFMMSRYREVADIVLRYLEHRDQLVRLSITSLLPRIAHFLRDRFVTNYLTVCVLFFLYSILLV